jgi:hypothetical protein
MTSAIYEWGIPFNFGMACKIFDLNGIRGMKNDMGNVFSSQALFPGFLFANNRHVVSPLFALAAKISMQRPRGRRGR